MTEVLQQKNRVCRMEQYRSATVQYRSATVLYRRATDQYRGGTVSRSEAKIEILRLFKVV